MSDSDALPTSQTPHAESPSIARWRANARAPRSTLARGLAGERVERISETIAAANRYAWSFVARTVGFDRFVTESIANGADMVVNLAAGLDRG